MYRQKFKPRARSVTRRYKTPTRKKFVRRPLYKRRPAKVTAKKRTFSYRKRHHHHYPSSGLPVGTRYYHHKLVANYELKIDGGSLGNVLGVAAMQNGNQNTVNEVMCFNRTDRWQQIKDNYLEYAVTGCKIEWMPSATFNCATNSVVDPATGLTETFQPYFLNHRTWMEWEEGVNGGYTPPKKSISMPGFKMRNPNRYWKHYINCRALARSHDSIW